MRSINFFSVLLIISAIVFLPANLSSRVTIGSAATPQEFSVLELVSNSTMGLRLPQLTTEERDALTPSLRNEVDAKGLLIFNTTYQCVETWSGDEWISFCWGETPDPCAGLEGMNTVFCTGDRIADLTARTREAGGRGTIEWFLEAIGGNPLPANHPLADGTTYWAGNCAGAITRTPVTVQLVNCDEPPTGGIVTTFTNVMYDFQQQQLFTFNSGGGDPIGWQWQVSTTGNAHDWIDIPSATSANWTIPANFVDAFWTEVNQRSRVLFFRCILSNNAAPQGVATASFRIHFINTTSAGYGERNGVRFLTIHRGGGGVFELALTNVGTNETGDLLGDLFQWGRRADGHQAIVWEKATTGATARANIFAAVTAGNIVANDREASGVLTNYAGQITNAPFLGRFVTGINCWSTNRMGEISDTPPVANRDLWGNGVNARSTDFWTAKAHSNNPCPSGWTIPSAFDFFDMHGGDGTGLPREVSHGLTTSGNHWRWHPGANGAVGGAIITNSDGEEVFLPAVGMRSNSTGLAMSTLDGAYWSSTFNDTGSARILMFNVSGVGILGARIRTNGMSIRCIAGE